MSNVLQKKMVHPQQKEATQIFYLVCFTTVERQRDIEVTITKPKSITRRSKKAQTSICQQRKQQK